MKLLAALDTHHAIARLALHALVLFLQGSSKFVPTEHHFCIALATATIGADAARAFAGLDEIMVL